MSDSGSQSLHYVQTAKYCTYAASVLPVYDWFLCLDLETRLVWNWHSGVTGASLVYAFSRYAILIQSLVSIATGIVRISDMSCEAIIWTQTATGILATIAFGVFSALRVYALSNRKVWLAAIIVLLCLPPTVIRISQGIEGAVEPDPDLPGPFNCISVVPPIPSEVRVVLISRASQLAAELFVVAITWWYAYQSTYRLRKYGVHVRTSLTSILVYNGSIYLLFLGTLYITDIIVNTKPRAASAGSFLAIFYDPITSVIVCHFMLSLRQFDSATADGTHSVHGSRAQELMASTGAAEPGDSLPAFISSFAQPLHFDSETSLFEEDPDPLVRGVPEWREIDVRVEIRTLRKTT